MLLHEDHGGTEPLGRRLTRGASAEDIGQTVAAILSEIDAALTPILGPRGAQALIHRALHLTAARHPFLMDRKAPMMRDRFDPTLLAAGFASQEPTNAWVAGAALLMTFHELLTSLVGRALCDQLLQSIWIPDSSGSTAQDKPS